MSELRDLTGALRAFDKRLDSIEDCLIILLRNSAQEAEWRHQQKNNAQLLVSREDGFQRAIAQLQVTTGDVSHALAGLSERLDNQSSTRLSDVKELRQRVRALETGDDVTNPGREASK